VVLDVAGTVAKQSATVLKNLFARSPVGGSDETDNIKFWRTLLRRFVSR
jgi:hypothetical protein